MPEYRLSEAELYIMEHFWQNGQMKTEDLRALVAPRGWKPTTLLTFLSRLAAKGMLAVERQGKSNLYRPLISRAAYTRSEGRAFLDDMYSGSARNFLAALVDGQALKPGELAELKAWLNEQEVDDNG